jgi:hypothetical protein
MARIGQKVVKPLVFLIFFQKKKAAMRTLRTATKCS